MEPPEGHSLLHYHGGSSRVRLDVSGRLHCDCRESDSASDLERVNISVVDGEGRAVVTIRTVLYPCLVAGCNQEAGTEFSKLNSSSVELVPEECREIFSLDVTDRGVNVTPVRELGDMQVEHCRKLLTIALHRTHTLYEMAHNSAHTVTFSIKTYTPFDMDSCAESLQHGVSTKLMFYSLYSSTALPKQHTIVRRDNTPPTFLKSFYSVDVLENSPLGTIVTVVQASDLDEGTDGEVTYSMLPNNNLISADYFAINDTTGEIVTTS